MGSNKLIEQLRSTYSRNDFCPFLSYPFIRNCYLYFFQVNMYIYVYAMSMQMHQLICSIGRLLMIIISYRAAGFRSDAVVDEDKLVAASKRFIVDPLQSPIFNYYAQHYYLYMSFYCLFLFILDSSAISC